MFDLKSLAELAKIDAAPDADGILYDPASKRVFSMILHAATCEISFP